MESDQERRNAARQRTIQGAKIVFGDYRYVIDCVVRDMSGDGARIKVAEPNEVPGAFHLFDTKTGNLTPAIVKWRTGKEIGVQFTGASINVHESGDLRLARFRYM